MSAAAHATADAPSDLSPAAHEFVLAFADDEHMIGARHTSWIGLGPFLEDDLAFCSIAQDELGHAIALYALVVAPDADPETGIDDLALGRMPGDYRSCWLAEWPTGDWATALVRHWLYDLAEELRWRNVAESTVAGLAALVPTTLRDEAFHRSHATALLDRVLAEPGATPARAEVQGALDRLAPIAASVWVPSAGEDDAVAEGVAARPSAELAADWRATVTAELDRLGLTPPDLGAVQTDRSDRSEHFADLHAEITLVRSQDPTAVW